MTDVDRSSPSDTPSLPFARYLGSKPQPTPLRSRITEYHRALENNCVKRLLADAFLSKSDAAEAKAVATRLVSALRDKGQRGTMQELVQEFSLSSQEGVALMCLAEALLRIPDAATRDALIRDKIAGGNWFAHLGKSSSIFVNAATWGLIVTGKLQNVSSEGGLSKVLLRLVARGGEPLVRKGIDIAMRLMGEQFVHGETISDALTRSRKAEGQGFTYSYDMLGEAAVTADDAGRYYRDYEAAIHAVGESARGNAVYSRPGISIKLSALHPRFSRSQRERVMTALLSRARSLCLLAKRYNLGMNIDAEEADRLDLSLDILEALATDAALTGWNGLGFVVQAYQKRAPFVLDFIVDLATRSERRIMVRLVKGAYWDSEIKRAQVDGLEDFPVFTRKLHTDISYLACARKLLNHRDVIFPQFATHNAQTIGSIYTMAGQDFDIGDFEFQCLHGMGEAVYEEVVGPGRLNRPCRIYAPVGTHETLLAYLVRRLLENGANSSFVNRIQDLAIPVSDLVKDPAEQSPDDIEFGASHSQIALPRDLYGPSRTNSTGLDLSNENSLVYISSRLQESASKWHIAAPMLLQRVVLERPILALNPADHRDCIGGVVQSTLHNVEQAMANAEEASSAWRATSPAERATCLFRAADLMEQKRAILFDLLVREAGKSVANAVSEVREAVDFLRYYGAQVRDGFSNSTHLPVGPAVCISPWNFPLAIFTGQVAAALAAGCPALAKPAEETPFIAAKAVAILREAGIPDAAVQLLPGDGKIGAALVADRRACAVMFTGSTEVAKLIQTELSARLNRYEVPVPLIAETGGQNALIVDSSALPEQVIADVLSSAFDSAGQRCSALRVLCLQDEIADRLLNMLRGAMAELVVGNPDRLSTDVGPVITAEARDAIRSYIEKARGAGRPIHQIELSEETDWGTFVSPTVIEINDLSELQGEVFGPVLHVMRFARKDLATLVDGINSKGYGLTFGVHSRLNETIEQIISRIEAGNIYVNRNMIGATVGVQPFGGHGLSGTGPKAGGPLYLYRLLADCPFPSFGSFHETSEPERALVAWLTSCGMQPMADKIIKIFREVPLGTRFELSGPVGEQNIYVMEPVGIVACVASKVEDLVEQIGTVLATGNRAIINAGSIGKTLIPPALQERIIEVPAVFEASFDAVLFCGDADSLRQVQQRCASEHDAIKPVLVRNASGRWPLISLVREQSISINTTAAGGNASLMMIS